MEILAGNKNEQQGQQGPVSGLLTVNIEKELPAFSLQIALSVQNEVLAVLGPSGAGKTTLLQCLAGLQKPRRGEIVLNGRVLYSSAARVNLPPRLRRVGYVFQDYALFPHLTVAQNAAYGMKGSGRRDGGRSGEQGPVGGTGRAGGAEGAGGAGRARGTGGAGRAGETGGLGLDEVLAMLQIAHLARRYPGQLSGGERQRAALARALLAGPELLLLDEPLSALDRETRLKVRGDLKALQRRWGIPFILVTHDLEEAAFLGDRVVRLERGQVAGWGLPPDRGKVD